MRWDGGVPPTWSPGGKSGKEQERPLYSIKSRKNRCETVVPACWCFHYVMDEGLINCEQLWFFKERPWMTGNAESVAAFWGQLSYMARSWLIWGLEVQETEPLSVADHGNKCLLNDPWSNKGRLRFAWIDDVFHWSDQHLIFSTCTKCDAAAVCQSLEVGCCTISMRHWWDVSPKVIFSPALHNKSDAGTRIRKLLCGRQPLNRMQRHPGSYHCALKPRRQWWPN